MDAMDMMFMETMGIDPMKFILQMKELGEICTEFKEKLEKFPEEQKRSALCMLFDMMYEENSVEVAEECLKNMKIVNSTCGALHLHED